MTKKMCLILLALATHQASILTSSEPSLYEKWKAHKATKEDKAHPLSQQPQAPTNATPSTTPTVVIEKSLSTDIEYREKFRRFLQDIVDHAAKGPVDVTEIETTVREEGNSAYKQTIEELKAQIRKHTRRIQELAYEKEMAEKANQSLTSMIEDHVQQPTWSDYVIKGTILTSAFIVGYVAKSYNK